ncbi:MAG: Crp/Fnr family transcriptional regulator [Muribaculaceae bacterium]|nr:Crp/Fnr family transcriptional regulator [Muribaculaceae bacterium]
MEELKRLLNLECDRTLDSKEWDSLFSLATEIVLQKGEVLISPGETRPDVYIVKEGIIRGVDFNGNQERTFCFGLPGTIFNSRFSFYRKLPSYYQIEACCRSVVLQISREDYIALTDRSHPFAVWALHYAWYEQYLEEDRESTVHNGTAKERYLHMLKTRPMIVKGVSQRVLASYLGVTPEYLCRVKASILREELKEKRLSLKNQTNNGIPQPTDQEIS